jgi:para-nitrobenzyl esterase
MRWKFSQVLMIAGLLTVMTTPVHGQDGLTTMTRSGSVRGAAEGGLIVYRGIPYAEPPIGDLRWQAPQPAGPWTSVRDATAFGDDCQQAASDFETLQTTPSEDCLYLNVWKPSYADPGDQLPVMVWIHGGGYVGGGSSSPTYDGSAFARQGIVVVSINYRLSRLGFFAHPAVLAAADGPVGNYGYMDQLAALRWVQDNVDAFGGDPGQVTIMGESAGGGSVIALLTSPLAEGLFSQAMVMSGGGRLPLVTRPMTGGTTLAPSADQTDATFAASLGVTGTDDAALAALRTIPAEQLVDGLDLAAVLATGLSCAAAELADPPAYDPACRPPLAGTPTIDGTIVTDTPEAVFKAARAADVPIIIGTTATDLAEYFPPRVTEPYVYFGEDAKSARDHYELPLIARAALVLKGQSALKDLLPVLSIGADMTMHEPARFVADQMTERGQPAWVYRFTYTAESTRPESEKQIHAGELPFLFDTLGSTYGDATTDLDRRTAGAFNTYVANFIKTGDPNGNGLPTWPSAEPEEFDVLDFTPSDGPVFGPDPRGDGLELVKRVADALAP